MATLLLVSSTLTRAKVGRPVRQADTGRLFGHFAATVAGERERFRHQVVVLGDSMLMPPHKSRARDVTITARLEGWLRAKPALEDRVRVYPFAQPGGGYSMHYFLAGELAELAPDAVLLEVNTSSLARAWRTGKWTRPDLVAWLGADRLPEALWLPLHRLGLTADRVLWLVACQELGYEPLWAWVQRQQLRVNRWYKQVRHAESRALLNQRAARHLNQSFQPGPHGLRFRPDEYAYYSDAMRGIDSDDVALRLLTAAVAHLEEAGVEVLVYLTPINVEHMRQVGVYDEAGMQTAVRHLHAAAQAGGGRFLDLHDLLGDQHFRDPPGHLTFEGAESGVNRVGFRLAIETATMLGYPTKVPTEAREK